MSEPGEVGVIVPLHGAAPFLEEALESVLAQRPAPAELVVVDDGSPEPLRLPESLAPRCRLLRRERRGGPARARQTGLEALGTPLIALCDADDAWEPGKLAAQRDALSRHPEAAACFGRATIVGADGRPTGERWQEPRAGLLDAAELAPALYRATPIPTSSMLLRRDPLELARGFASSMPVGEDWDLWLRLVARGEAFACEPRARVRYRRHGGGLTADTAALARAAIELHERHAALVDERTRASVRQGDLLALARGRIRERDYAGARAAFAEAARVAPLPVRERARRLALSVPGLRGALGRRSPYPAARS